MPARRLRARAEMGPSRAAGASWPRYWDVRRTQAWRAPSLQPKPRIGGENMAKEELLEFNGTVTEVLPDGNYRVTLDNDHEILAYMSGKMRKFRIRTGVGDRVVVEVSPYDLTRGRINFR